MTRYNLCRNDNYLFIVAHPQWNARCFGAIIVCLLTILNTVSDTLVIAMNFAHHWKCVILVTCLAVLLSEPLLVDSQEPDMRWQQAADSRALCNDYTRAGFFISRNQNSRDWIIFFESGGVCYSRDTCNRRFFSVEVLAILTLQNIRSFCPS